MSTSAFPTTGKFKTSARTQRNTIASQTFITPEWKGQTKKKRTRNEKQKEEKILLLLRRHKCLMMVDVFISRTSSFSLNKRFTWSAINTINVPVTIHLIKLIEYPGSVWLWNGDEEEDSVNSNLEERRLAAVLRINSKPN